LPTQTATPAPTSGEDARLTFEKPDFGDIGKAWDDVNVSWYGEMGAAVAKAEEAKTNPSGATSLEAKASGAGEEPLAQADDDLLSAFDFDAKVSAQNPSTSVEGVKSDGKAAPEAERGTSIDTWTDEDFNKALDTLTAKRLLGPRFQSERDKAYERGFTSAKQAAEQELALARASKQVDFDDTARETASKALGAARTSTAHSMLMGIEEAFGNLAEEYGLDRSVAKIEGKTFKNMTDYARQVVDGIMSPVVSDKVKRESASQAKELVKAALAKRADQKRASMPNTPDFIPSSNPSGAISNYDEAVKAYAKGEIDTNTFMNARRKAGVV